MPFDTIKKLAFKKCLLSYPNFNDPFAIHTYTSKLKLGLVLINYSYSDQVNYTITGHDLLSIVESLEEYRTML